MEKKKPSNKKDILQERTLEEASLDHQSYASGSDLELDSVDEEQHQTMTLYQEREEIAVNVDAVNDLTPKPKDKYKFIRSIGFGGMKAVLQVRDKDTTRNVAMAIIPDFQDRPAADINRFIREARITARLEHPNIVPIHDIGVDSSDSPYFTMKFLRGKTLANILKKLSLEAPDTLERYDLPMLLRIFVKVCNAVAFAHSKHIIHLDLKPENIHVGDFGEVLVLDWGLAKFIGDNEDEDENEETDQVEDKNIPLETNDQMMTMDGVAKGTPGYMAPEQAAGKNREKDERTDIYGLGCILYAILTFQSPFAGSGNVEQVLEDTVLGNLQAPRELRNSAGRAIPAALEAVCLKAMERFPEDRYQSVSEMRRDIFAFMSGYAPEAENAGSIKKTFLFISRNFLATVLIICLLLLFGLCGSLVYLYVHGLVKFDF